MNDILLIAFFFLKNKSIVNYICNFRPVSALLEVEVNQVNPKKLIETLNRVILELHGPFQVVLIVNTHTNHMNESIRNEIIDLFHKYKSFAMFR